MVQWRRGRGRMEKRRGMGDWVVAGLLIFGKYGFWCKATWNLVFGELE